MTPPSPKIIKILEGKAVYDEKHGWMNPEKTQMLGNGFIARIVNEFMRSNPELYDLGLALLKERYATPFVSADMPELKDPRLYIAFIGDILDRKTEP
jgi:hypothetical protein